MEYQAGVLITSVNEADFGELFQVTYYRPLRPVRASLDEVTGDLAAVRSWIRRERRENQRSIDHALRDWGERLSPNSYEIHIRVTDKGL